MSFKRHRTGVPKKNQITSHSSFVLLSDYEYKSSGVSCLPILEIGLMQSLNVSKMDLV
jgi:hypothetical protein